MMRGFLPARDSTVRHRWAMAVSTFDQETVHGCSFYSPAPVPVTAHRSARGRTGARSGRRAHQDAHPKLADGTDYYTINPLGWRAVPVLDDGAPARRPGHRSTLADLVPEKSWLPPAGSFRALPLGNS